MKRVKVWDPAVRLSHLAMGVLVLAAFLTSEEDDTLPLHMRLGLGLLGVVLFRIVWGFVGSTHARFSDFVKGPKAVLAAMRGMVRGKPEHTLGHNPVGALMVVTLLVLLAFVTVTGIVMGLGPDWSGPLALSKSTLHLVKEVHEGAAEALPVLIVLHVLGVLLSSVLEKQNLIGGMVTGFKRADAAHVEPDAPSALRLTAGFLMALVLAAAAVFGLWRVLPTSVADAAPALLSTYEQQARAESPSFKGFDVARGKALYFTEHPTKNGATSCATCHAADARLEGRSPVGKRIDPLAPSANPDRFTDAAKAMKWFDRNCTQVLGRTCTAVERGDFLTYLASL